MHPRDSDPAILNKLGLKFVKSNPNLSKQYFEQAAALNYQPSLNNLAIYYLKLNNLDVAYKYLVAAVCIYIDKYVFNNFGIYYTLKGEYLKAIRYFKKALNFNSNSNSNSNSNIISGKLYNSKIYYTIANCYAKLDFEQDAITYYKISLQYGNINAAFKLVYYYEQKHNLIEMIKYFVVILNMLFYKAKSSKKSILQAKYQEFYMVYFNNMNTYLASPDILDHMYYLDALIIAYKHLNTENLNHLSILVDNKIKRIEAMSVGS